MDTNQDEATDKDEGVLVVPAWLRLVGIALACMLWAPAAIFLWSYWHGLASSKAAADLGLYKLMIAGTSVMLVSLAPWNSLKLRLKKVGIVEFDRVVNKQAEEHIKEFADLRARLEELENRVRDQDSVAPVSENVAQVDLQALLLKFLEEFRPKAFSPVRIQQWGARQPGYEKFASYSQGRSVSFYRGWSQAAKLLSASAASAIRSTELPDNLHRDYP
jgi:hypothetical protein